ncbi:MAG TPA: peptidoglycan-binding protein [Armatimonadota bacterium]|nr:peptidoglycan-binding protein [Armatimonadota bacterium]
MEYPGAPLRRDSTGEAVRAVQARLGVQLTARFGPTTEEVVATFQRGHGLEADGVVGPATWRALFVPEVHPYGRQQDLGLAALEEAVARVGVRESPRGSNRGPEVDEYNRVAGAPPGSFWCMSFVQFCVDEAARKLDRRNPLHRTASCSALYRWAREQGRLAARPEPGDIFLCIGGERGHYHTGFVRKLLGGERFSTVEGNSNDDGSANGVEVAYRPQGRRLAACHYVRL